jgi:hypothetical protein
MHGKFHTTTFFADNPSLGGCTIGQVFADENIFSNSIQ